MSRNLPTTLPHTIPPFLLLLASLSACNGGSNPPPVQDPTDGDGVLTTGITTVGGDDGLDGADDTEGIEPQLYCIFNEDNAEGLQGVKHQCSIEYDLDITMTIDPPVGGSFQHQLFATAQTGNDSTYEQPMVMACCTDVTGHPSWPLDDSCPIVQHRACMSDFIEHICGAPATWLRAAANGLVGQGGEALDGAADWFAAHRNDCYAHFWSGDDALHTANFCEPVFDAFFEHTPWEPGLTWEYQVAGITIASVSNISIAPRSAQGSHVPIAPPNPAEPCSDPASNNGISPPFPLPAMAGPAMGLAANTAVVLAGPDFKGEPISGAGVLGPESQLLHELNQDNELVLGRWSLVGAQATTAGTPQLQLGVDGVRIELLDAPPTRLRDGVWTISADTALFDLVATVEGVGSSVQAHAETDIQLHTIAPSVGGCPQGPDSCILSGSFTIGYDDESNRHWSLLVPPMTWVP